MVFFFLTGSLIISCFLSTVNSNCVLAGCVACGIKSVWDNNVEV